MHPTIFRVFPLFYPFITDFEQGIVMPSYAYQGRSRIVNNGPETPPSSPQDVATSLAGSSAPRMGKYDKQKVQWLQNCFQLLMSIVRTLPICFGIICNGSAFCVEQIVLLRHMQMTRPSCSLAHQNPFFLFVATYYQELSFAKNPNCRSPRLRVEDPAHI